MDISIIVIGDEILLGQVTDTNSGMIARTVSGEGWNLRSVKVVPDDVRELAEAVSDSLGTVDVLITTGGIGPTKDDMTKNVMSEIFGGTMAWDDDALKQVEKICQERHIGLNELTRRQAYLPTSCKVIQNNYGTAPVMVFNGKGTTVITLPGVPYETENLIKNDIVPFLREEFEQKVKVEHRNMLVFGITESALAEKLADFEDNLPENFHLAYLPKAGYQHLRLDGQGADRVELNRNMGKLFSELRTIVKDYEIWDENLPIASIAGIVLREKGYTLSSAESCTGGNIARLITSIPGSSEFYKGSVVAYSNEVKENILGVAPDFIKEYGAVSLPVVEQMAKGVKRILNTDCAVATSGIAGPGGGSAKKPVGTVCISVHTPETIFVDHFFFKGKRDAVIERASNVALIKLIRLLRSGENE